MGMTSDWNRLICISTSVIWFSIILLISPLVDCVAVVEIFKLFECIYQVNLLATKGPSMKMTTRFCTEDNYFSFGGTDIQATLHTVMI